MFCFSKKYNIKINTRNDIVKELLSNKLIKEEEKLIEHELYFIKNSYDLSKIDDFNDIKNFAIISHREKKIELKLYDKEVYTTFLDNIYSAIELLLFYGYEVAFEVNNKIYKYNYRNINFYIQYVNDKEYFLTFDEKINEKNVNEVIDVFKNELNMNLDDKLYFDIIQSEFNNIK